MILPEDEMTIQRMLGKSLIPSDIHDEYMARVRFLHKEVSGGPMGPGMIVDMLRFLGYMPSNGGGQQDGPPDWRSVDRGTLVQVRRAGHWTSPEMECRFEGFVDSGTLAVLLPGGRVDEFNKCDVRLKPLGEDISQEDLGGTMRDGKPEPDDRLSLVDDAPQGVPEDPAEDPRQDPPGEVNEKGELVSLDEPTPSWPTPSWRTLKKGDPLWVREWVDGEPEVHDAKFVKKIPKNVKVLMVVGDEEVERTFPQADVRKPDL